MIEIIAKSFITEKSIKTVENLAKILAEKYASHRNTPDYKGIVELTLYRQLPILMKLTKDKLAGKRILDLGCGSRNSRYERGTSYEPWFCRGVLEMGVIPTGIDINGNEGEMFQHHQIDLEGPNEGLLSFLPSRHFDIVTSAGFFSCNGVNLKGISAYLVPEIERVGKPEAFFVHDESELSTGLSRLHYRLQPKPYALSEKPLHFLNSP